MDSRDTDVLIIGGGVIGLACAHYLLAAGRSVRVIDGAGVGSGTSHGNCGTITPSHAPPLAAPGVLLKALRWMTQPAAPLYIAPRLDPALAMWLLNFAVRCNHRDWQASAIAKGRLLRVSRQLLQALVEDNAMHCEFRALGLRYVHKSQRSLDVDCAALPGLLELGIESDMLDGAALAGAEPALLPGLAGGIHFPGDAHLRPEQFTAELARVVRSQGGVIEEGVHVSGLSSSAGRISEARTVSGSRRARDIVVALGPWSAPFLRELGLKLPIQPGKGYSITYSAPTLAPKVPLVLREHSVCVTAWDTGFRLGSTMEFSGYDASLNQVRLDALEQAAARFLREPTGPVRRAQWAGWRPMTYDDLPLIGRAPRLGNLWLATGHGMMGMGMSAVTGRLLSELMSGAQPCVDPGPSNPARFF